MASHPLLVALASILLSVLGQFALKAGATRALAMAATDARPATVWSQVGASLLQPAVLGGLGLYAAGAMLWIYVLGHWDVSKAYPLLGLGFVLTLAIGAVFLGERVTGERVLGCALICGGIVLVVRS